MTITNATLTINSKQYDILNFCYKFQRDIDAKGRPRGVYYGGEILVQMESTDDSELFRQTVDKKTTPVAGCIEVFSGDGTCVRRIDFEKAYLCALGEEMQNNSSLPMTTTLSISPMRLDFNNTLRLDRRWPEAPHGWQKYEAKEAEYVKPKPQAPPTPLVTGVKGKTSALPNAEIEYNVTSYNINVTPEDRKRVKWVIEVDSKQELQKQQGETMKLTIKEEWVGKEIAVMPYLKKPTKAVSVKTLIKKKIVVFFIGGAGDKRKFMGQGPFYNILTPYNDFNNNVKQLDYIEFELVYLGYYEVYPMSNIAQYVLKKIPKKDVPVYIVGHSFGGWNGAHLSRTLTGFGYTVKMLITLDPVNGDSGVSNFADIYHNTPMPTRADFWINITTDPKDYGVSDFVADLGYQWIPSPLETDIFFISKNSHLNAGEMFTEKIKDGKSALDFLIESIKR